MPYWSRVAPALVLAVFVQLAGAPALSALAPVGEPFRLDDEGACAAYVDLARLADGGFVAVWVQAVAADPEPRREGVHARLFDADGTPRGPAFLVDAAETLDADHTPVVAAGGGGFLVAWLRSGRLPYMFTSSRILARTYATDGTPRGDVAELGPTAGTSVMGPVVDAAAAGDAYRIVWLHHTYTVHSRVVDAAGEPGDTVILDGWPQGPTPSGMMNALSVASDPGGFSLVVEASTPGNIFGPQGSFLAGRRFRSGRPLDAASPLRLPDSDSDETVPAVGTDAAGNTVVAWREEEGPASPRGIRVQGFARDGTASTGPVWVTGPGGWDTLTDPALAVAADGSSLVVWGGRREGAARAAVVAAAFDRTGRRLPPDRAVSAGPGLSPLFPDVLGLAAGEALVAWNEIQTATGIPEPSCRSAGIRAQRFATGFDTQLLLRDGRFAVRVEWRNPYAADQEARVGIAEPLSDEAGWFWFFRPDNAEVVVKVLDGRAVNGHFWVFWAGLSSVEYTVRVVDRMSGAEWTYRNPGRTVRSGADTRALPASSSAQGSAAAGGAATAHPGVSPAPGTITATPCDDLPAGLLPPKGLCLHHRFAVTLDRFDDDGDAHRTPERSLPGGDSGYFWFFRPDNAEVFVKVLDARGVDGRWWLFAGSLTSLPYSLTVLDTVTGEERTYDSGPGAFRSFVDTRSFVDSPP